MENVDTSRRGFLKSAVAASGAIMAAAAANAGIPASAVKSYEEEFDVVIIGSGFPAWPALSRPVAPVCAC